MCTGGDGGIRTLDRALQPYNGLANRRLQPLGHISRAQGAPRHMPDASRHCKRPALELGARWSNEALRGHPTTGSGTPNPDDLERSVAAAERSGTAQGQDQAEQPASLGPAQRPAHSHAAVEAVTVEGEDTPATAMDAFRPLAAVSRSIWVPRPWSPVFDARPLRLSRLRRPSAASIRCARQRLFPRSIRNPTLPRPARARFEFQRETRKG